MPKKVRADTAIFHKIKKKIYKYNGRDKKYNKHQRDKQFTENSDKMMSVVEKHEKATFAKYSLNATIIDVQPTLSGKDLLFVLYFNAEDTKEKFYSLLLFNIKELSFSKEHRIDLRSPLISKKGLKIKPIVQVSPVIFNTGTDYIYVAFPKQKSLSVYSLASNQLVKERVFHFTNKILDFSLDKNYHSQLAICYSGKVSLLRVEEEKEIRNIKTSIKTTMNLLNKNKEEKDEREKLDVINHRFDSAPIDQMVRDDEWRVLQMIKDIVGDMIETALNFI